MAVFEETEYVLQLKTTIKMTQKQINLKKQNQEHRIIIVNIAIEATMTTSKIQIAVSTNHFNKLIDLNNPF